MRISLNEGIKRKIAIAPPVIQKVIHRNPQFARVKGHLKRIFALFVSCISTQSIALFFPENLEISKGDSNELNKGKLLFIFHCITGTSETG